jgi:hypothetical protein
VADYTNSKDGLGRVLSENAIQVQWEDIEPLISPEILIKRHLFGLPLVSGVRNPTTRKFDVMTPALIKEYITDAVAIAEEEARIDIFPRQYKEKQAFDRAAYQSFGYFQLRHLPIDSIQDLTVTTSSQDDVYRVPLEWIDIGFLRQGQMNILPLTLKLVNGVQSPLLAGPGGSAFLAIFGNFPWIASFWQVTYTTGFKDGAIPKIVNQYIGTIAAMEVISSLAATYSRTTSNSLNMDGLGQSISGPGPELYRTRLGELETKRKLLCGRLKNRLGVGILVNNV